MTLVFIIFFIKNHYDCHCAKNCDDKKIVTYFLLIKNNCFCVLLIKNMMIALKNIKGYIFFRWHLKMLIGKYK